MMQQKKQRIAALICLALFIAGCLLSSLFSKNDSSEWNKTEGNQIVISEILPSNRTYPGPDGQFLDFIEIHNLSASSVDISGYMLSDDLNSIGYTFPEDTILPAFGYAVCWCDPDSEDERYANFGISREGGETIYLYNGANVLVDEKAVPFSTTNISWIRITETVWEEALWATPGFANTEDGYRQWLATVTGGDIQVTITEIMTDNSCVTATAGAESYDWVELTNTGAVTADLSGAYLSNDPADPLKWQIPAMILEPGQSTVIYCAGNMGAAGDAPFGLSKVGCTVILTSTLGNTLSQVDCPDLLMDHSFALTDGAYITTDHPTPGFANTQEGYAAWLAAVGAEQMNVVISEVMTTNRSTILSAAGKLCDWVELTNFGSTPADLSGAYLSDDPAERGKWRIGRLVLTPGESVVIPCVGQNAQEGEADFALSSSGCTLILSGSAGNILSQTVCPRMDNDRVWALQNDGTYRQTDTPTPGLANTPDNALNYRASQLPLGDLAITEVMSTNDRYLIQSDGRYYDWVELTNISDQAIDLSNYCLSDDPDNLGTFQLPQKALNPGEQIVILCSARNDLAGSYIHAPFTLSAEECWIYATDQTGNFSDYLRISQSPAGCSAGRLNDNTGTYYFTQPTPGKPNGNGLALITPAPTVLTPAGVYDNADVISIALDGSGAVHYTLDGSIPTVESPVYTQPLTISDTTVLRAVSFEEGKLPSAVTTACYIVNEGHTLPVVNLVAAPEAFTALYSQTANQDDEIPCTLSLYEENGSFSLDCGLEMMSTNTAYPEKKSMKVNFRGRYGNSVLGYPVFGDELPPVFESLCLQAGSEHNLTLFRDELFTELCLELTDNVPAQHYKFCVLYVNGKYYGIYSLKEDISEMLYGQQRSVAAADVEMATEPGLWGSDLQLLSQYCKDHDMTEQTHFDYLASQVDTESLIDWMILQGYCGNSAIANDLTYFRTPETGNRWQLGFFDLDNGFTAQVGFENVLNHEQPHNYLSLTRAIAANPAARQQFLVRLAKALAGTLSDDHVLSLISDFEATLSPEIQRERQRWGGNTATWQADVERLKAHLTRYDHQGVLLQSLKQHVALTDDEAAALIGG